MLIADRLVCYTPKNFNPMKHLIFLSLIILYSKTVIAADKPNQEMVEFSLPPVDEPEEDLSKHRLEFAIKYAAAATPKMRRNLCLDAMDMGLLSRGMAEAQVLQIFGANPGDQGRVRFQPLGNNSFVIHFGGHVHKREPEVSTGTKAASRSEEYLSLDYGGSYLFIQCADKGKTVKKYYISNSWTVLKGFDQ